MIVTRFAPSVKDRPAEDRPVLHPGHVLHAMLNWIWASKGHGRVCTLIDMCQIRPQYMKHNVDEDVKMLFRIMGSLLPSAPVFVVSSETVQWGIDVLRTRGQKVPYDSKFDDSRDWQFQAKAMAVADAVFGVTDVLRGRDFLAGNPAEYASLHMEMLRSMVLHAVVDRYLPLLVVDGDVKVSRSDWETAGLGVEVDFDDRWWDWRKMLQLLVCLWIGEFKSMVWCHEYRFDWDEVFRRETIDWNADLVNRVLGY